MSHQVEGEDPDDGEKLVIYRWEGNLRDFRELGDARGIIIVREKNPPAKRRRMRKRSHPVLRDGILLTTAQCKN